MDDIDGALKMMIGSGMDDHQDWKGETFRKTRIIDGKKKQIINRMNQNKYSNVYVLEDPQGEDSVEENTFNLGGKINTFLKGSKKGSQKNYLEKVNLAKIYHRDKNPDNNFKELVINQIGDQDLEDYNLDDKKSKLFKQFSDLVNENFSKKKSKIDINFDNLPNVIQSDQRPIIHKTIIINKAADNPVVKPAAKKIIKRTITRTITKKQPCKHQTKTVVQQQYHHPVPYSNYNPYGGIYNDIHEEFNPNPFYMPMPQQYQPYNMPMPQQYQPYNVPMPQIPQITPYPGYPQSNFINQMMPMGGMMPLGNPLGNIEGTNSFAAVPIIPYDNDISAKEGSDSGNEHHGVSLMIKKPQIRKYEGKHVVVRHKIHKITHSDPPKIETKNIKKVYSNITRLHPNQTFQSSEGFHDPIEDKSHVPSMKFSDDYFYSLSPMALNHHQNLNSSIDDLNKKLEDLNNARLQTYSNIPLKSDILDESKLETESINLDKLNNLVNQYKYGQLSSSLPITPTPNLNIDSPKIQTQNIDQEMEKLKGMLSTLNKIHEKTQDFHKEKSVIENPERNLRLVRRFRRPRRKLIRRRRNSMQRRYGRMRIRVTPSEKQYYDQKRAEISKSRHHSPQRRLVKTKTKKTSRKLLEKKQITKKYITEFDKKENEFNDLFKKELHQELFKKAALNYLKKY